MEELVKQCLPGRESISVGGRAFTRYKVTTTIRQARAAKRLCNLIKAIIVFAGCLPNLFIVRGSLKVFIGTICANVH